MKEVLLFNTNPDENSELLIPLFLRMEVFWDINWCSWVSDSVCYKRTVVFVFKD
jgi:hypothetical protein